MTWTQTATGRKLSLTDPDPAQVDFAGDVAPALAKLARFNGHTIGYPAYSVAQHCVLGAEGLEEDTRHLLDEPYSAPSSRRMAALFLLHDAHEAYMGDICTPVVAALDHIRWPDGPPKTSTSGLVGQLVKDLKHRLDVAIHAAAGIKMPNEAESKIIRHWDARMMRAERLAFMANAPESWGENDKVEPAPVDFGDYDPRTTGGWDTRIGDCVEAAREWMWAFEQYVRGG